MGITIAIPRGSIVGFGISLVSVSVSGEVAGITSQMVNDIPSVGE